MNHQAKIVLITGGGSGIGAAIARQHAAQGDQVILLGRRAEALQAVAAQTGAMVCVGDAAQAALWPAWIRTICAQFGRLDVLVNCAGVMRVGSASQLSLADWQASMRGNLDAAFVASQACLPMLIESAGNIVFVASVASLAAGPQVCGYVTAKHALIGLMRSIARDYGSYGVRANAICPGWVRTPMADEEMQPFISQLGLTLEQAYQHVTRDVPLGRPATADEIAALSVFLSSSAASILTGATLVADGGGAIVDVPTLAYQALPSL